MHRAAPPGCPSCHPFVKFHTTIEQLNLKVMGGIGVGHSDRKALATLSANHKTAAANVSQMQADILPAAHAGMNKGAVRYAASRLSAAAKSADQNLDTHPRYQQHRSDADITGFTADFARVKAYANTQASASVGLRTAIFGAPSVGAVPLTPPTSRQTMKKAGKNLGRWTPKMLPPPAVGAHYSFFEFCALWKGTLKCHRGECMLYLQADPRSRHVRSGQYRPEPLIPLKKTAAYGRYKLWLDNDRPSTLALLKEAPGIECVAHGGWGKGKTGRPTLETTAETDGVTEDHLDSRGSCNGVRATTKRLGAKKRRSLEAKGLRPTKKQATVDPTTARNYHALQTAGKDAIKIAKAVDNTGPR